MRTLLLLVLLSTSALADAPRYTRKQNVVIDVRLSDRARPLQPTAVVSRPVTATEVMAIEEQNEPLRREQAAILGQLVNETPDDDPDKPDLLFRLAEHYAKQQRLWRLKSLAP